jgi:hypothetical protein
MDKLEEILPTMVAKARLDILETATGLPTGGASEASCPLERCRYSERNGKRDP